MAACHPFFLFCLFCIFRSRNVCAISTARADTSKPLTQNPFAASFTAYAPQPQPAS